MGFEISLKTVITLLSVEFYHKILEFVILLLLVFQC